MMSCQPYPQPIPCFYFDACLAFISPSCPNIYITVPKYSQVVCVYLSVIAPNLPFHSYLHPYSAILNLTMETLDNSNSSTKHPYDDLLTAKDEIAFDCLNKEWTGSIFMEMNRGGYGFLEKVDIMGGVGNPKSPSQICVPLYFDTKKFPPPSLLTQSTPKQDDTWVRLRKEIQCTSHKSGSPLSSNGSCKGKKRLDCYFCSRQYRGHVVDTPGSYRNDALINNDKGGRRENGRSKVRRINTKRSLVKGECCNF